MTKAGRWWLACLLLLGTACGVPVDESPRVMPRDDVPFGLLDPARPRPVAPPLAVSMPVEVFFVAGDRLVAARRDVRPSAPVGEVAALLLPGPTAAEAQAGLRTAVGAGTVLRSARVDGRVAVLDFSATFAQVEGREEIFALAQVVYTATGTVGVDAVAFTIDGQAAAVPVRDGTLRDGPLSRRDFPDLAPT